jgi:hypothetical protein
MNDGHKKKGQKHQNRAAFKIQFDPLSLEIHKKVSFKGYLWLNIDCASDVLISCSGGCNTTSTTR